MSRQWLATVGVARGTGAARGASVAGLAAALVAAGAGSAVLLGGPGLGAPGAAQTLDVGRARTFVVGVPRGARAIRVDGARTGACREPLPVGSLRVAWQTPVTALLAEAPLVDASGTAYVVGSRGEVFAVGREGTERWHLATGAVQPGAPALLSDDTLVFADALGEAVAVRNGAIRWRVRFGRGDVSHPAALPLADGGVVVATAHDLTALDVEGGERARITLPEVATGPLIARSGRVLVTGESGTVWSWSPGAPEVLRAGSFGGAVEGGAALVDAHTLVAVTGAGTRLSTLDLSTGASTTLAQAGAGLWRGPATTARGNVYLALVTATAELAVGLDPTGAELLRARLSSRSPLLAGAGASDGGALTLAPIPHAPALVGPDGALAFATTDGAIATVVANTVELVPGICAGPRVTSSDGGRVSGIAPAGAGLLVASCHGGLLVGIAGSGGGAGGAGGGGR